MRDLLQNLAQQLRAAGVENAFGVTGSGATWDLITFLEEQGVRYYPAAHEAAGAIMAGGAARSSGKIAAALSIKGPGMANMLPGLLNCNYENIPVLTLAEAYDDDVPAYISHKRLNHDSLLASVVKQKMALSDVDPAGDNLRALLGCATAEVPGPVHLELKKSAQQVQKKTEQPSLESKLPDSVIRQIEQAQRPLLIVGSLALRREWRTLLADLKIPVLTTVAAKGAVDEQLPQAAGIFTGVGKTLAPENALLPQADLVIGIGLRHIEVLRAKTFAAPLILLDEVDQGMAGGFGGALTLANDAAIKQVLFALQGKAWGSDIIAESLTKMRSALINADDWLPAQCFDVLNRAADPYALVLDTGSFCTIGEHLWDSSADRPFFGSSNGRYMGTGLPTAIGVSIGRRDLPVVCAVGDGGMRMYPAEIKLAVTERLPLCVILMSDGVYGSIATAKKDPAMSSRAVTIDRPSWWQTVGTMGCAAVQVRSVESFAQAFAGWDRQQPLFIEAAFDAAKYRDMTADLR